MMKPLVLLPLSLLAVSCYPADPYYDPYEPRPRNRQPAPYAPQAPGYPTPQGETGTFEPIPGGNPPPGNPAPRPPAAENRAPTIPPSLEDTPAPQPPPRPTYPEAKRTANPNQVISPYAPYNVIDVEGFKSGALAKDPSNGKIFRVP